MILLNPYFYITFIGLCAKIYATKALYKTGSKSKNSTIKYFWGLLIACYMQTLFEVGIYLIVKEQDQLIVNFVLCGYYVSTLVALALLPIAIGGLLKFKVSISIMALNLIAFVILSCSLIFTDYLVVGFEAITYAVTRIPGDYYFVFQAYVVLMLLVCLVMLLTEKQTNTTNINSIKASNLLIGFIPVSLVVISVILLMSIGIEVNMVGPVPLLMAIFIISIANNIDDAKVFDYRIYIPWSKQAKLVRLVSEPFCRMDYTIEAYSGNSKLYEEMLIKQAIEMFSTRKEAARWLGMSESKISRALNQSKKASLTH